MTRVCSNTRGSNKQPDMPVSEGQLTEQAVTYFYRIAHSRSRAVARAVRANFRGGWGANVIAVGLTYHQPGSTAY